MNSTWNAAIEATHLDDFKSAAVLFSSSASLQAGHASENPASISHVRVSLCVILIALEQHLGHARLLSV